MGRKRYRSESSSDDSSGSDLEKDFKRLKRKIEEARLRRKRRGRKRKQLRNDSSSYSSSNSSKRSSRASSPTGDSHQNQTNTLVNVTNSGDIPLNNALSKDLLNEVPLSDDILKAIGKRLAEDQVFASPLHSQLAIRCKEILQQGLPDEENVNLMKKYPLPQNCVFFESPKVNLEIKSVVQLPVISRDTRIILKQQKIASCFSAIAKAFNIIISENQDSIDVPVIECLSDAIRILGDLQRNESSIRRSLIISNINNSYKETLTQTECSTFLFGDKLDEVIKSAKALEVSAKDLRVTQKQASNKQPKNLNVPPRLRVKEDQKTLGGRKPFRKIQSRSYRQSPRSRKDRDYQNRNYRRK